MASKLHQATVTALQGSKIFSGQRLIQEAAVQKIFPKYASGREKYDIVLPDIKLIIECHGIQHYKVQTFGSKAEEAVMNFQLQQKRDSEKKEIALLNGWIYLEIPYTDEKLITDDYIYQAYSQLLSTTDPSGDNPTVPAEPEVRSEYKDKQLARAREARRSQYRKMKEYKDANRRSNREASGPSEEET